MTHVPVLLQETIDGLAIRAGETFLDCTVGGGGHAGEVCRRFGSAVRIIALDADASTLRTARNRLSGCTAIFVKENFRNLDRALAGIGVARVEKILFDLGLSSMELEESGRGFSLKRDEPLLMTFDDAPGENDLTAREIVNRWEPKNLVSVLTGFGEERYAARIVEGIVAQRAVRPIERSAELAEIVMWAVPKRYRGGRIHPATRTFQALRIAVNDELGALSEGLRKGFEALSRGGRIAVISFHSLEDRLVKLFFRSLAEKGRGQVRTKRPITPGASENALHPRGRSAKLRIFEKAA